MKRVLIQGFIALSLVFGTMNTSGNDGEVIAYQSDVTRILFLLDGSGSMKGKWGEETKFDVARNMLYHLVDSLEKAHDNVEFAVRVFGHQSPRSFNDCKDSEIEIPFSSKNADRIRSTLMDLTPQGHSPIAYSLFLAAQDFPDPNSGKGRIATNAIIIITDGKENCDGDPCAASRILEKKRIALQPYIIGLNINDDDKVDFDCIGRYFEANDKSSLDHVIDVVVSQAMNTTTAQVNLLDKNGKPTITNYTFSLYDHYSGEVRYNFVHGLLNNTLPDTLYLDPVGKYDLEVHTIPPTLVRGIELVPGTHNVIAVDLLQSSAVMSYPSIKRQSDLQVLIREAYSPDILYVQDVYEEQSHYLTRDYDFEILSQPLTNVKMQYLAPHKNKELTIERPGSAGFSLPKPGLYSVYTFQKNGGLSLVYENEKAKTFEQIPLQPGKYFAVYRPATARKADFTKTQTFEIKPNENTSVRF